MKRNASAFLGAFLVVLAGTAAAGPEHATPAGKEQAAYGELSIEQVAELVRTGKATVLDANSAETRSKFGIIPDAKLLTTAINYDVERELPSAKDAKLVFYCVNPRCTASDVAAKRAIKAGYKDVSVLRAGIMGWKDAGQKTVQPLS